MRISDWSSDVCSSDLVAGFLCVAQEARVDPGVAEAERFAVYAHRPVLKRADQFFSRVHQRIEIAAMFPPLAVCGSDEYLERRIAGPRAHPGKAGVDTARAFQPDAHPFSSPDRTIWHGGDCRSEKRSG